MNRITYKDGYFVNGKAAILDEVVEAWENRKHELEIELLLKEVM